MIRPFGDDAVAIASKPGARYPSDPPYPYDSADGNTSWELVTECFRLCGLDSAAESTRYWNPLGRWIRPGQTVLLKPNLVKGSHPRDPHGWQYVMTHGSVIRAVADYVWRALENRGTILVADAPQTDSCFETIRRVSGLNEIAAIYQSEGRDFRVIDLRREGWINRGGVIVGRKKLPGDPAGYIAFDLSVSSEFQDHSGAGSYYGADYSTADVNSHHSGGRHEYLVSATPIRADVVISLPKLKTHKKAGITAALKNLVGINGDKNWLPHHTEGAGGDEHPDTGAHVHRLERHVAARLRRLSMQMPGLGPLVHRLARSAGGKVFGDSEEVIRSGNWYGNDTIWRTCLDLNKILAYGNDDGSMRAALPENRKIHLVVVDGILAGEGRGPLNPDPVDAGLVLFGTNPASVDAACAVLMGFDPDRIPIVRNAFRARTYPLVEGEWRDVRAFSSRSAWNRRLGQIDFDTTLQFEPHFGWKNHIEQVGGACPAR